MCVGSSSNRDFLISFYKKDAPSGHPFFVGYLHQFLTAGLSARMALTTIKNATLLPYNDIYLPKSNNLLPKFWNENQNQYICKVLKNVLISNNHIIIKNVCL